MPGYVMHLAEARLILNKLKENRSSSWEQAFLLGNLLPDTRLKEGKAVSHFWNPKQLEDISRAPDLSMFLCKYGGRLNEPVILGYYAHLYLDACYVNKYWPRKLCFKNKLGMPEKKTAEIRSVEILDSHMEIPFKDFFTKEYYYGDYSRSNGWFISRYKIVPPEYMEPEGKKMDEVDFTDIKKVLDEFHLFCSDTKENRRVELKVFDLKSLDTLLHHTAAEFCSIMEKRLPSNEG